jgi:hypothetical protein
MPEEKLDLLQFAPSGAGVAAPILTRVSAISKDMNADSHSAEPVEITPDDEIDALRIYEDLHYCQNRAQLGQESVQLVREYVGLYDHLWAVATAGVISPLQNTALFTHQMVIECRADLVRTMLLLLRGHLIEAHGQTRRAIECCVWARRIKLQPDLVQEWMTVDMTRGPSKAWKDSIKSSVLFPEDHPQLRELRQRYQVTSRCVHPFRFSFEGRTGVEEHPDGRLTVTYSFFDPEEIRLYTPTRFLWTLQTHDLIFNVFDEIFSREIGLRAEEWLAHRKAVAAALTKVGKFWIATTERSEARKKQARPAEPNNTGDQEP